MLLGLLMNGGTAARFLVVRGSTDSDSDVSAESFRPSRDINQSTSLLSFCATILKVSPASYSIPS